VRTIEFPELESIRVELDEEFVARQFVEISAALEIAGPAIKRHRLAGWRRWMASVAVGVSALVPAAAAASESAVPGDVLYSVKRVLEPLVQLVNGDVVAEHRIEELEVLELDRADQDVFDSLLQEATDAVARIDSPPLSDRLDAVVDRRNDTVRDTAADSERDEIQEPSDRPPADRQQDPPEDALEEDAPQDQTDTEVTDPPDGDVEDAPATTRSDVEGAKSDELDEPARDTEPAETGSTTTTAESDDNANAEEPPTGDTPTTEPETDTQSDRP